MPTTIQETRLQADDLPVSLPLILPAYLMRAFYDVSAHLVLHKQKCFIDAIYAYCLDNDTDPEDYRLDSRVPEIKKDAFAEEVRRSPLPQVLLDLLDPEQQAKLPEYLRPEKPKKPEGRFRGTKLTASQVAQIRELLAVGNFSQNEIAKWFKVHYSTISLIATGERWRGK